MTGIRGHSANMVTLGLEAVARKAEANGVSFIHAYPGFVKSGIGREAKRAWSVLLKVMGAVAGPFIAIPFEESGERHVFIATSARYGEGGVEQKKGDAIAVGSNGEKGSGVYSVDEYGESAGPKALKMLENMRKDGMIDKLWKHTEDEYVRITGTPAMQ